MTNKHGCSLSPSTQNDSSSLRDENMMDSNNACGKSYTSRAVDMLFISRLLIFCSIANNLRGNEGVDGDFDDERGVSIVLYGMS
jgi:hypothetical protein